jgi:hypothetical protein
MKTNITVQITSLMVYALFLASLQNRAGEIFRGDALFLKKSFDFFQKKSVAPIDFSQGEFIRPS